MIFACFLADRLRRRGKIINFYAKMLTNLVNSMRNRLIIKV